MYPFLQKVKDTFWVRLNKELYPEDVIERARKEEPGSIVSCTAQKGYYLVELRVDDIQDYFSFLNYLIYLKRT